MSTRGSHTVTRSIYGVTICLERQNWAEWSWTEDHKDPAQPLLALAATIIGPVIMDAITVDVCATSSVEDGRFFGELLAMEHTLMAQFDPTQMIDAWVEQDIMEDTEGRRDAMTVLAWLEAQAVRLRRALAETEGIAEEPK